MIQSGLWQEAAIDELIAVMQPDASIRALILMGSFAEPLLEKDAWSDIDITVVVDDEAQNRFYPSTDWLKPLGKIFAIDQSVHPNWLTTRVCFTDMRRIDFSIIRESTIQQIANWDYSPFEAGFRVLFLRSDFVDAALVCRPERPRTIAFGEEQLQSMANKFWFKGALSVTKVMRNDPLIGLHLALDMIRDCLELAMLLRDRAENSTHHRTGGAYNDVVNQLDTSQRPYTPAGILDIVEQCSVVFDKLAMQMSAFYRDRRKPLIEWLEYARSRLPSTN